MQRDSWEARYTWIEPSHHRSKTPRGPGSKWTFCRYRCGNAGASTVFLLADEPHALAALACILRAEGFAIRGWMSAAEFLDVHDADTPGCLITDVNMREISGLEVQRILLARGIDRPIIFITDQGDIRTTVLGMKAGAITFLAKPVLPNEVIGAVREAFAIDSTRRAQRRP